MIVAPGQEQSKFLYLKIRHFIESNPYLLPKIESITATEVMFKNKSIIRALPCGPEGITIRGFTADTVVLEESSGIKDSIVQQVITPMVASTDGQIIQIGTPLGKNHFFRAYDSKDYEKIRITWREAVEEGVIKQSFIDKERDDLTSMQFASEYGAEFVENINCFFPSELVESIVSEEIPIREFGSPDHSYYLGVDPAKLGQDSCVITLVECVNPTQLQAIKIVEMQQKELRDIQAHIEYLDAQFRCVKICVDKNGLGEKLVEDLRANLGSKVVGVNFTLISKMDLYNNLKLKMEKGYIRIPRHQKLIWQLKEIIWEKSEFEDKFKIHHPERGHDDFPDSLALAIYPFSSSQRNITWGIH